jgi:hypothetical protein
VKPAATRSGGVKTASTKATAAVENTATVEATAAVENTATVEATAAVEAAHAAAMHAAAEATAARRHNIGGKHSKCCSRQQRDHDFTEHDPLSSKLQHAIADNIHFRPSRK